MEQTTVYLALGSNKGDKQKMLNTAKDIIEKRLGKIEAYSKVYKTKAVGYEGADYLNSALKLATRLNPSDLLYETRMIEKELGRKNKTQINEAGQAVYEARCIDIDILYYDTKIISKEDLIIPHPRLHERTFVLQPLCDIAPKFVHPILKKNNTELLIQIT